MNKHLKNKQDVNQKVREKTIYPSITMSKLIIFDIDGTLTDTKAVENKCFMAAFEQTFSINISHQKWEDLKHVTDWGITEELVQIHFQRTPTDEEYALILSNFTKMLEYEKARDPLQFSEVQGAKAFFDHIRYQTDFKVAIATGSWEESALIKLRSIGIDPTFIAFANSDHFKSREKITKYAIELAFHLYRQNFSEITYFGDGVWDFRACKNLGIKFIGIDILGDGKLKALGAEYVFRDYRDRNDIIKIINPE